MTSVTRTVPGQSDLIAEAVARAGPAGRLLDIGAGQGGAARAFHAAGWRVAATGFDVEVYLEGAPPLPEAVDLRRDVDICAMDVFATGAFDAVWCAHVLEHTLDTGRALAEIRRVLRPGGRLFLAVPPFKPQVVGGHVTPGWNIGILMYVLAVAGFDVRGGRFARHGYNVFADVVRDARAPPQGLRFANGDIETLRAGGRLPDDPRFAQGFDGDMRRWNWSWTRSPTELPDGAGEPGGNAG